MSLADQLEKLLKLKELGALSDEEFAAEKARLFTERSTSTTGGMGGASGEHAQFSGEHASQLGAYRVLGLIGEGGMGSVYRARHIQEAVARRQGGEAAIKVMHAHYANREDFRARFEREADVGLRLDHPNLVNVHDLVMDGGQLALVMEYVEGRPLSKMIGEETGPIPWERAWPLFGQILDGVAHAHAAGIVHRDLKPENIMVTEDGTIKVLDFGIAKADDSSQTKTGTGMGTVDYMAPEQYLDASRVDHRADIYALGMTLYEMLAGRLPWEVSTSEFDVMDWKRKGDLPLPTQYYPSIPPYVVSAIMKSVSVDLEHRPSSIPAFRELLEQTAKTSVVDAHKTKMTSSSIQKGQHLMNPPSHLNLKGGIWAQFFGGCMIIFGALYSITIIGAIVGIPALLAGLAFFNGGKNAKTFVATGEHHYLHETANDLMRGTRILGIMTALSFLLSMVFVVLYMGLIMAGAFVLAQDF